MDTSNITILVYGKHPDILATVLRLINKTPNWRGEGSTEIEEILDLFRRNSYNLVLLGGGIEAAEEQILRAKLIAINPNIKIIQHYGGGSGLLKAEVELAIA